MEILYNNTVKALDLIMLKDIIVLIKAMFGKKVHVIYVPVITNLIQDDISTLSNVVKLLICLN